jgi:CheY-like chemotaxis protein
MKKRILLVEDDPSLRRILTHYFERELISVVEASNGNNALEILGTVYSNYIDLIMTDYMMPYLNGYDMALKIREIDQLKDMPIILYTNLSHEELERKREDLVFNRILHKASTQIMINTIDEFPIRN